MRKRTLSAVLCVVVSMIGAACEAGSAAPTAPLTLVPPAASMTPRVEATGTDSALADVQRTFVTPTVSLAQAQPTADATSLPTAFDGPLPPGAVARYGTGIIPVYAEARNQELASPDGRYIAIPSGAGMHIYRSDTGAVEWIDRLDQLVYSMEWSPDGSMLAAGSWLGGIVIWDVQSGKRLHALYAHHGTPVDTLDWSPDGNILASGGSDARVILWNPRVGAPLRVLEGDWNGSADILVFSPDSTKILAGYHYAHSDAPKASQPPTVWDVQNGQLLYTLDFFWASYWFGTAPHNHWSSDGKLLAADETIYDAATGTVVTTLDSLGGVAWSPAGSLLAVVGERRIGVWDAQSSELVWCQEEQDYIAELLWSDDGMLLLGANGENAKLWNASSGQLLHTLRYKTSSNRVAWSPDGALLFVHTYKDGDYVMTLDTSSGEILSAAPGYLADISWSSNGPVLVTTTATWATRSVTLTDAYTGEVINELLGTNYVLGLAWSPDGDTLAVASTEGYQGHQVTVWDVQTHAALRSISLQERTDYLSWSPDSRLDISGLPAGTMLIDQTGLPLVASNSPLAISPQESLLIVGDTIWDTANNSKLSILSPMSMPLRDVAWSPDGTMLVTAGNNGVWSSSSEVIVWNAQTGSIIRTFQGNSIGANSVAWSPDGARVVSGAYSVVEHDKDEGYPIWGNEVIIWDVSSGEALLTLEIEAFELTDVAWSPDGKWLAVASGAAPEWLFGHGGYSSYFNPGKVTLLDAQTGQQIKELKGHSTSVQTIAFSPDGSLLASGSLDGTVIMWDVSQ